MEKKLYFIVHPIGALIGSQLEPQAFANHYKFGSAKHYGGKLIFAEIDINFRNPYFDIDNVLGQVVRHEDGRPKATKFISTYRVLEHLDFSAFKNLYLVNPDGSMLEIEKTAELDSVREGHHTRTFAEINPLKLLTLSSLDYREFGKYITSDSAKSAPKICYTQLEFSCTDFLTQIEKNAFYPSPIAGIHPINLKEAILEMKNAPTKKTKGLSLNLSIDALSYKYLRHGIVFSDKNEIILYKMPTLREIEDKHIKFWKGIL